MNEEDAFPFDLRQEECPGSTQGEKKTHCATLSLVSPASMSLLPWLETIWQVQITKNRNRDSVAKVNSGPCFKLGYRCMCIAEFSWTTSTDESALHPA